MKSFKIEDIQATANGGAGPIGLEAFVISAGVGGVPEVTVEFNTAVDAGTVKVEAPFTAATAAALAAAQTAAFQGESTLLVNVTKPTAYEWRGYRSAPEFSVSAQDTLRSLGSVGLMAALGRLNTTIYLGQDIPEELDTTSVTGSIAKRLEEITRRLIKAWQSFPLVATGSEQELAQAHHARNTAAGAGPAPLDLWYALLAASNGTTVLPGLEEAGANSVLSQNVNATLEELLLQMAGDFWSVVNGVCAIFNLLYVPDLRAPYIGKLVTLDALYDNPVPLNLDVFEFADRPNGATFWPISQILIRGVPTVYEVLDDPDAFMSPAPMLMGFPQDPTTGGALQEIGCPRYFTTPEPVAVETEEFSFFNQPGNLSPAEYKQQRQKLADSRVKIHDNLRMMLQNYARQVYIDMSLAGCTAVIEVPLNFAYNPGTVYQVRVGQGAESVNLLTGFLGGVMHSIRRTQNDPGNTNGGDAVTRLQFTHVRQGDFALPGL